MIAEPAHQLASARLFFLARGGLLNASQNLSQALTSTRLGLELSKELAVGSHQGSGAAHHKGDLVIGIALVDKESNTCKCGNVVFNGTEGVIQTARDLIGLESLEIETHGLYAVSLARTDVLLLAARGDFDLAAAQGLDVTHDRTDPAVEKTKGEVLVAEQPALLSSLRGDAKDSAATKALDAMSQADLIVLLAGIEREQRGDLLAFLQRLAGRFFGSDDKQPDLTKAELVVCILGSDGEDVLDGRQDRLGDEGRAVGTLFDPPSEHAVEGLGIETPSTKLVLDEFRPYHERHLRVKA